MRLSGIYPGMKLWAMVYHIDPRSELVEFVGVKGPKFFRSKAAAQRWFAKKFNEEDYIEPEAVEFTGFSQLKITEELL